MNFLKTSGFTYLAALSCLLSPGLASAVEQTLPPTDDSYTSAVSGSSENMQFSFWEHAFIRFDLSSIDNPVSRAVLKVNYLGDVPVDIQVWAASHDNWDENSGAPEEIGFPWKAIPLSSGTTGENNYVELDITGFIQQEISNDGIASLELSNNKTRWQPLGAKEGANPPQLIIETNENPGENQMPVASFTVMPSTGSAPLDAQFDASTSSDPDGSITAYQWDFGDGNRAEGITAAHRYLEPGSYNVILIVADNLSATDVETAGITVHSAEPSLTNMIVTPASSTLAPGETQLFTATGRDQFDNDAPATPVWTVSGGGSIDTNGVFTAGTAGGPFTVTATDGVINGTAQISVEDNPPQNQLPIASFSATPGIGTAPLNVQFDASNSIDPNGIVTAYSWDFGDGNTAEGINASHRYSNPGSYSAVLTVTDNLGATDTDTATITVTDSGGGGTLTLRPTDDTFSLPGRGAEPEMAFSQWDHAFVRFDLSGADGDVTSAVLRVYYQGSDTQTIVAWPGDNDNWSEFGTPPDKAGFVWKNTAIASTAITGPGYVELTITDFIVREVAGDRVATIELSSLQGQWRFLSTKEGFNPPELVIETNGNPTENQAPVAQFVANPSTGEAPLAVLFDASASFDPEGGTTTYSWDFGDGNTAEGINAAHSFSLPGNYSVVLTVTDNLSAQDTETTIITVHSAEPTLSGINVAPASPILALGETQLFTATGIYQFGDDFPLTPSWSVGGGGSIDMNGAFTATDIGGPFTVTATHGTIVGTAQVSVEDNPPGNQSPVAIFSTDPGSGNAPLAVHFDASASNDPDGGIVEYRWDFGDGGTDSGVNASHTYGAAGVYSAALTVTDNAGATNTSIITITVSDHGHMKEWWGNSVNFGPNLEDLDELANPGSSTSDVAITGELGSPARDGIGAFRFSCDVSHFNYDDPIVFPRVTNSIHLHMFFGNTGANADSTYDSLRTTGNSTCLGGTINKTAYWVPAMLDGDGNVVVPSDIQVYYKTGYHGISSEEIAALPNDLRMIAGNAMSTVAQEDFINYQCRQYSKNQHIIDCPEELTIAIQFPQCWDGVNLDSINHKSHMAYASNGCPDTHPVALPEITYKITYDTNGGTQGWRLSSDMYDDGNNMGYSAHGDWLGAWESEIKQTWTENCLNAGTDCKSHLLGDGRAIY